ncbi:MAG: rhomboid family intramembrane serine protease [Thermodesulfovibrionales bacterium]|nr:rhomboid family intramembrane serine protease [Thermodesulfovibrionales bacterium]
MIPFKDDNPTETFPIITILIIVLNSVIFIWQITSPLGIEKTAYYFGAIPHNLLLANVIVQPISPTVSIFTSMFLHGGFLHLIGNMLYLWIFGNNIEDALGHIRFLIFYLFSGVVAVYSHAITDPSSFIPMIGASGAVSGILGAYLLLYPKAKVYTIFFFGFFWQIVRLPAIVVIGFWAIIQIFSGMLSYGIGQQGGVAWFAHIGGFLIGLLTIKLWLPKRYRYNY